MAIDHSDLDVATAQLSDLDGITAAMTRAFDHDHQLHLGLERGGPPGYDTGEFYRNWLFGHELSDGYVVRVDGEIVAAAIVWDLDNGDNILGNIFVDPAHQGKGLGTAFWEWIQQRYTHARSWRLSTQAWATRNHYFYTQKCGFKHVDSDPILGDVGDEFVFHKQVGNVTTDDAVAG